MRARNGHALRASSPWSRDSALTAHWMGATGAGLLRARSGVIGWRIGGGAGKARSGLIGGGSGLRRVCDTARVMEATSSGFRKVREGTMLGRTMGVVGTLRRDPTRDTRVGLEPAPALRASAF